MSKRKTVLKFAIAAVLLGVSSTVAVLYFPYVALAIKFGVVISVAPLAIFAVSAILALASLIGLGVLTVSAIRNNGKSNQPGRESRSKNEKEGPSLVQEEEKVALAPAAPLLPQEPEELVTSVQQQQPVDGLVGGTEIPQPENVVVEQMISTDSTKPPLPPYPEPTSPMNSLGSLPFPSLPPTVVDRDNSSRNARNLLPNPSQQTMVKVYIAVRKPHCLLLPPHHL